MTVKRERGRENGRRERGNVRGEKGGRGGWRGERKDGGNVMIKRQTRRAEMIRRKEERKEGEVKGRKKE